MVSGPICDTRQDSCLTTETKFSFLSALVPLACRVYFSFLLPFYGFSVPYPPLRGICANSAAKKSEAKFFSSNHPCGEQLHSVSAAPKLVKFHVSTAMYQCSELLRWIEVNKGARARTLQPMYRKALNNFSLHRFCTVRTFEHLQKIYTHQLVKWKQILLSSIAIWLSFVHSPVMIENHSFQGFEKNWYGHKIMQNNLSDGPHEKADQIRPSFNKTSCTQSCS